MSSSSETMQTEGSQETTLSTITPEASSEALPEVSPEVSMESSPEVSMESSPEVSMESSPEVSPEVSMESSPEVSLEASPEVSPEVSMEASPEVSPEASMEASPEVSPEEMVQEEATPSEEGESLGEPVVSESKQMDKDKKVVDEAAIFRRKLNATRKRLPTLDEHQKDEIRHNVINEFINILKISKRTTTRKKLGRRINNLRGVFNETLDLLNGTAKKRQRKRKTKKQVLSEVPPVETFSENQS